MATTTKSYTVTEAAGRYLLGRRVKAGDTVMLTENQAAYELARGIVVDPEEKAADNSEQKAEPESKVVEPAAPLPPAVATATAGIQATEPTAAKTA